MKTIGISALIILGAASLAMAAESTSTTRGDKPYFEASSVAIKHATVLAVDKQERKLTLKSEKGDTLIVPVKPEVKTLEQIKVGDRIKFTYSERFTVRVDSTATGDLTRETMRSDAKAGEKPRASVAERVSYLAAISAIDQAKGTVTLRDATGTEFTMTPLHPENLALVTVGEKVVFTNTSSMAAEIVKEQPKKPVTPKK
jgi:hypothetical protein